MRSAWRAAAARGPAREKDRGEPPQPPAGAGSCPFSTGGGLAHGGGRHRPSPGEAGNAGGRRLLGHRLPDSWEAAPRAAAAPPQRGGEMNSPSSGRRQEEPWTPGLVQPEAAKLWARPHWLAASSRFASRTGQVVRMWGGGSGQPRSSHFGASEWGPGGGGDGSWAPLSPATPPSPYGGGAPATRLSIVDLAPTPLVPLKRAGATCDFSHGSNWDIWIQP